MDLSQNPFFILGATPRDNRKRIMELAEERSLVMDADNCTQARSDLTNPRKRLIAEVAWLPGIGLASANEIIAALKKENFDLLDIELPVPMAMANLISTGLSRLSEHTPEVIAKWINELACVFDEINPNELCIVINEERIAAGFPEITDLSLVESEIQTRRAHFRQAIKSTLDCLLSRDLVKAVTLSVQSATDNGNIHGPILIHDLVDAYEVEVQPFFEKETKNIETLIEEIKSKVKIEKSSQLLNIDIDCLIRMAKNWDTIAQPIQISCKSRGLRHDESHEVANLLRDFAIYLFNEHDELDLSKKITDTLSEVFAEVDEVAERINEDSSTLEDISKQRLRKELEEEKWRRSITYQVTIGAFFGQLFKISPDGIDYRGRLWKLDSITKLRWGGTRHSVNGIPAGTTYKIFFGTNTSHSQIELKDKTIYSNITERLWRAIGVRLLTQYLEGLRAGKKYHFGKMILMDTGVELPRRRLFSSERVFCPWNEIMVWSSPGVFCVNKIDDNSVSESFSYGDEDNIHVLEAGFRLFLKSVDDNISDMLNIAGIYGCCNGRMKSSNDRISSLLKD